MKSLHQIDNARDAVVSALRNPNLSDQQTTLLSGISIALQWVAGDGGSTLQRLIDGEPMMAGHTVEMPIFTLLETPH